MKLPISDFMGLKSIVQDPWIKISVSAWNNNMRLIDMRRTRRLAESYYRIIRAKGYSDELNVSEDELRRMLGVTNLRYDNSGYAELNFSTEKNSQAQQLFFWGDIITDVPIVYKDGHKFEKWRKAWAILTWAAWWFRGHVGLPGQYARGRWLLEHAWGVLAWRP